MDLAIVCFLFHFYGILSNCGDYKDEIRLEINRVQYSNTRARILCWMQMVQIHVAFKTHFNATSAKLRQTAE